MKIYIWIKNFNFFFFSIFCFERFFLGIGVILKPLKVKSKTFLFSEKIEFSEAYNFLHNKQKNLCYENCDYEVTQNYCYVVNVMY